MALEISSNFGLILDVIAEKSANAYLADRFELRLLLQSLSTVERILVARQFCKSAWNIGSLRVLSVLQQVGILSATEFVLCFTDTEQLQLILNDFLEAEYELITNIFISAYHDVTNGVRLHEILDECLRRLYLDLIQNPRLNCLDYLKTVKAKLSNVLLKIIQKHICIILELHNSSVQEAFTNFATWINEGVDDIKFTKDLYEKLMHQHEAEALSYLFKLSTTENFTAWKFYLILLQTIVSHGSNETAAFIRKYLKTRLSQIASQPCKNAMLHLLLTARAATARTMDIEQNINAYSEWYKQHISDMKFIFTTEEFQAIVTLLEQCISHETAEDYLEIHATISISPPVLCGKLVQTYKSKCKRHLAALKAQHNKISQTDNSILITDSD